jgi:hypothetical protein
LPSATVVAWNRAVGAPPRRHGGGESVGWEVEGCVAIWGEGGVGGLPQVAGGRPAGEGMG